MIKRQSRFSEFRLILSWVAIAQFLYIILNIYEKRQQSNILFSSWQATYEFHKLFFLNHELFMSLYKNTSFSNNYKSNMMPVTFIHS